MLMKNVELLPMFCSTAANVLQYCFPQFVCMVFILGITCFLLLDDDNG
jgi:hypothetical protein